MKREAAPAVPWRDAAFLALLGAGAFLALSLAGRTPLDDPRACFPAASAPRNWGGLLGAWLSIQGVGWVGGLGSWTAALLLAGWGLVGLRRGGLDSPLARTLGGTALILALATVEYLVLDPAAPRPELPGGIYGCFLGTTWLAQFGGPGAWLTTLTLAFLALLLATDLPAGELGRRVSATGGVAGRQASALRRAVPGWLWRAQTEKDAADGAPSIATAAGQPVVLATSLCVRKGTQPAVEAQPRRALRRKKDSRPQGEARPGAYARPPISLLAPPPKQQQVDDDQVIKHRCQELNAALAEYQVDAQVVSYTRGPTVTLFEVALGDGVYIREIDKIDREICLALKALKVRVVGNIPGRDTVGIEIPNIHREVVPLRTMLEQPEFDARGVGLPMAIGRDIEGRAVFADLTRMPHLLIAGETGSGKSIGINALLMSFILSRGPEELRLILVDPKFVEFEPYKDIPHLVCPVITEAHKVSSALDWLVQQMEERLQCFSQVGVRDLPAYNALGQAQILAKLEAKELEYDPERHLERWPYLVLVIDELSELMQVAKKEIEGSILRLAQKSRAAGIHIILATQRPSAHVITGDIKVNIPTRVAYTVRSNIDSRTILDQKGAEELLGEGDLLYMDSRAPVPVRCQGAYVSTEDVQAVCGWLCDQGEPHFDEGLLAWQSGEREGAAGSPGQGPGGAGALRGGFHLDHPELVQAAEHMLSTGVGSVTAIQRRLNCGFNRASDLADALTALGILGPKRGGKPREVLVTFEEFERMRAAAGV